MDAIEQEYNAGQLAMSEHFKNGVSIELEKLIMSHIETLLKREYTRGYNAGRKDALGDGQEYRRGYNNGYSDALENMI